MAHIKINRQNLFYNLDYLSSKLLNANQILVSLKDNAYGHGIIEIANLCSKYGIKHCLVKNNREAEKVKKYFESILVLYDFPSANCDKKYLYSISSINKLNEYPEGSSVEIKINTGMNRNGIQYTEIEELINILKEKKINIRGVFTHFANAEQYNGSWKEQEIIFKKCIRKFKNNGFDGRVHCANSAGILRVNPNDYDLFRLGISVYGYLEIIEENGIQKIDLRPVLSLWANRNSKYKLKKGDYVGYGDCWKASSEIIVSNYDIGYGDGLFRVDEEINLNTKEGYKIIGRVSMDSISIISDKEEICIFDDADCWAVAFRTIPYDILVKLSPYIKREIV